MMGITPAISLFSINVGVKLVLTGKVRKLGGVKCLYENFSGPKLGEGKNFFGCMRCGQTREYFFDGVCDDCFCKIQKKKGCICPFIKLKQNSLYHCSLCEEFHGPDNSIVCKECVEKQVSQSVSGRVFYGVFIFIGIIICLFLGWLFLVVMKKKKSSR